ncbi:MAG: 50S ribosomal protein L22 [Thermoplasmata archaeon]|jgi:large subunit ribosomal protein L22|nr:50S ribosomal protein L22 [Thermoplasmata archaeon]MCI4359072.1 50S ribosomal protein L22 [Thermoplasmata archaeon]
MRGYTYPSKSGETIARARAIELPVSPKKTYEVLNAIRGRGLEEARTILTEAAEGLHAIPFRRYNQETAHHRGSGPGRFPKKVAHAVLEVLKNAEANAEYEGMDTDDLVIVAAASARGRIQKANMPRAQGRATAWNEQTTNIEIILGERTGA